MAASVVAVGAVMLAVHVTPSAGSEPPVERREFRYTGSQQEFEVPGGVARLTVTADGARGGYAPGHPNEGGLAGMAKGTISVHAGQKLYVEVGGQGGAPESATCAEYVSGDARSTCTFAVGGFNGGQIGSGAATATEAHGGAGGGGGSDVQTKPGVAGTQAGTSEVMSSRLIVAGGGGGMGGLPTNPGSATPARGGFQQAFTVGGEGDGGEGHGNGGSAVLDGKGGKEGGAGAGGEGGAAGEAEFETSESHELTAGGPGSLGEGGVGSSGNWITVCEEVGRKCHFVKEAGGGGGGGGGGYYGGGGGGGHGESEEASYRETHAGGGGGGGAGSSYAPGGQTGVALPEVGPNGLVVLEWTPGEMASTGETGATGSTARTGSTGPTGSTGSTGQQGERAESEVEALEPSGTEEPNVKIKIKCRARFAEAVCKMLARAEVKEDIVDNRVIAVTASRGGHGHHRRSRSIHKAVVVGDTSATVPAGQTAALTLKLNAAGRRLLRKDGRLPVSVRVSELVDGKQEPVKGATLTLKPHRTKRHRR